MSLRAEVFVSLVGAMETALNAYLALDPQVQEKLAQLQGRVIAIELESAPGTPLLTFYVLPGENGIELLTQYAGEADTILSGMPLALAKMSLVSKFEAIKPDYPDTGEDLFSDEVVIRGDVELGQHFRRILDEMDIDWEEHLSHLTGDIVAHKTGNVVREVGQWWQQALGTLASDAGEFMQQESELLPEADELSQFMQEVDLLRSDLDRLEERVQRLSR